MWVFGSIEIKTNWEQFVGNRLCCPVQLIAHFLEPVMHFSGPHWLISKEFSTPAVAQRDKKDLGPTVLLKKA